MGKIFGISDNPVSIPTSPFEPIRIPEPVYREEPNVKKFTQSTDQFVHSAKSKNTKITNIAKKIFNRIIKK